LTCMSRSSKNARSRCADDKFSGNYHFYDFVAIGQGKPILAEIREKISEGRKSCREIGS
jgi:hypothetical protein